MRSIAILFTGIVLSACTTVSVLPQKTVVSTTTAISEQSELRLASTAYIDTAIARGWVPQSASWSDVARVLIDGRDGSETATSEPSYAERLTVQARHGHDAVGSLVRDASDARLGLSELTDEVEILIASRHNRFLERADVTSYERVLVHAQRARRSFVSAASVLTDYTGAPLPDSAEFALSAYDQEIDRARRTANRIADLYAHRITGVGL